MKNVRQTRKTYFDGFDGVDGVCNDLIIYNIYV